MERGQIEIARERGDERGVDPGVVHGCAPRGDVVRALGLAVGDEVECDHVEGVVEEVIVELVVEELGAEEDGVDEED